MTGERGGAGIGPDEVAVRALRDAYHLVRAGLFRFDPEDIHERVLSVLGALPPLALALGTDALGGARRPVHVAGIDFPGVVGVAAGLDKDGRAARAWPALGFGFVELGTVTAHAQPGNPRPRLFRLRGSSALINRMGFNNAGAPALADRLADLGVWRGNGALGCPVGVSLGKTKATPLEAAVPDYLASLEAMAPHADYVAVNVSSPNTPGLRRLQDADALDGLVRALVARADALTPGHPVPVFVKVAPDLDDAALDRLVGTCEDAGVAGFIATNTTLSREGLASADQVLASQDGGLSGAPLTRRARAVVRRLAGSTHLPVMGVGGIMTPADALALLDAGASLVQVFTGFVYHGPALVLGINHAAARRGTERA